MWSHQRARGVGPSGPRRRETAQRSKLCPWRDARALSVRHHAPTGMETLSIPRIPRGRSISPTLLKLVRSRVNPLRDDLNHPVYAKSTNDWGWRRGRRLGLLGRRHAPVQCDVSGGDSFDLLKRGGLWGRDGERLCGPADDVVRWKAEEDDGRVGRHAFGARTPLNGTLVEGAYETEPTIPATSLGLLVDAPDRPVARAWSRETRRSARG
ncbi:hypothetical protein OBBRIDRAFT_806791 [Obba rivulosa]|uniref:Uncharacterized protein n=1 Tax=Obba rivulosa TaxID=1052685 RepID=A0A8E2DL29_9APHY|nr:hypothetical protein OBBRIDRAFT_806791 [Obba rivulosa]